MTLFFIFSAYVANVFLTRYLNYILYKMDSDYKPMVGLWFIPIASIIAYIFVILTNKKYQKNWFTGKYW